MRIIECSSFNLNIHIKNEQDFNIFKIRDLEGNLSGYRISSKEKDKKFYAIEANSNIFINDKPFEGVEYFFKSSNSNEFLINRNGLSNAS